MKKTAQKQPSLELHLLLTTLSLLVFGLIMIYSASTPEALQSISDKFHFVKLQLQWTGAGVLALFFFSRFPLRTLEKIAPHLMGFGLILLLLVLIPGVGTKVQGARRWLVLPGFTLQPSELVKLIEIIYLSSWLHSQKVNLSHFLAFLGLLSGLVLLQPDMGTTVTLSAIAISLYFLADYPIKNIIGIGVVGIIGGLILILSAPYRAARLKTFLNPRKDPLGSSYHIRQIVLALGSGGLLGKGIGKSLQKYEYLPEATTDSIFAVIGEELGFVGAIALIGVLIYLIFLGFTISQKTQDPFKKTLASGITVWFAIQVTLNLSSMVALTPLTGIPLPLVSYGGSALITMLSGIGLLLNVSKNT